MFSVVGFFTYRKVQLAAKTEAASRLVEEREEDDAPPKKTSAASSKKTPAPVAVAPSPPPKPAAVEPAKTPTPVPNASLPPSPAKASTAPAAVAAPTTAASPPAGGGSADVQAWINGLKISGVRGGASPKVLIDKKTFSVGDVVNDPLGLVFAGYDANRDLLRFTDKSGAIYERHPR